MSPTVLYPHLQLLHIWKYAEFQDYLSGNGCRCVENSFYGDLQAGLTETFVRKL